jgi:hypothetical protein
VHPSRPVLRRLAARLRAPVGGLLAALLLGACNNDDPFRQRATQPNNEGRFTVFALTGAAPGLPAAIDINTGRAVVPEVIAGRTNFDLAFDVTATGRILVLPAATVAVAPGGGSQVGIQLATGSFESVARAPIAGYRTDSSRVVAVGEVVLFELPRQCVFGEPYYGKLVVDTLIPATRRLVIRALVNRNCGYRGLGPGLPTD